MFVSSIPVYAATALQKLNDSGFEVYLVGGCVRDMLLGSVPHDWDITTNALPEQIIGAFEDFTVIPTGLKHGTVTVLIAKEPIEITTYRIDGDYSDNRRPDSVSFTRNLKEDLARRDFTINALAMDADGNIVDYFGGTEDIKIGIIRCVGNATNRFTEDALRILRALRFAAVLGFWIDTETKKAICSEAQRLHNISAERINVELTKLLCGRNAVNILREYAEIVAVVIPEIKPLFGFNQQNPHHIYDAWEHTLQVVANTPPEPVLRWAALLHDIGKPQAFSASEDGIGHFYGHAKFSIEIADEIMVRLKFDNASRNRIKTLIEWHDLAIRPAKATVKRRLNRLGTETLSQLFKLQRADNLAHAPKDVYKQKTIDNLESIMAEIIAENECFFLRDLAVNGNDMLALGFSGKAVGDILDELLNTVIDGKLPNEREILLDEAKKRFQND